MENRNRLDSLIGFISPKWELERTKARLTSDNLRKFDGASKATRRTAGWNAGSSSANTESRGALDTLRNRSRDMVRNNSYAKTAIDVITTNTIGTGIRPSAKTDDIKLKTAIQKEWDLWADSKLCDFDGNFDFYGIQELVMRAIAESGECLVVRKRTTDKINLPLQLQVLESDYLYSHKDYTEIEGKGRVVQGVEFDAKGKKIGYWLYPNHPGDQGLIDIVPIFLKASDVIHIFKIDRPGQVRGIPWGSSTLILLKDLADYQDAELMRQKTSACFAGFISDTTPPDTFGKTEDEKLLERIEPGIIEYLPPGKSITFANPTTSTGYSEYVKKVLQSIASGYGVTYESLTGDLSNVNFSSGRMGWLEFHRRISSWQYNLIIPVLCDTVWDWFIEAGNISGKVKQQCNAEWTAPKREMIDPIKEINGINLAIRSGLTTWSEAIKGQGYDPNEVAKEMKADYALFDDNGLILDIDGRKVAKAGAGAVAPSE
jgi:lambda family phage portal protein